MSFLPPQWQPSDTELKDRTVLITGAGNGIGRAVALACAKVGAEVLLLGRNEVGLEAVYDDILSAGGREAGIIPFDLNTTDPGRYEALAEQLTETGITLDGLVHNASILGTQMPIEQYDIKLWYSTIQINLNAPFMLTQFLIPALLKSDDARIIFLSSTVGRKARAYWGAYSVSKFGIEGFAKTLSEELEKTQISVNTVNPGKLRTEMRRTAYPAEDSSTVPLPEEKSQAIVHLLSSSSPKINGEQLTLSD